MCNILYTLYSNLNLEIYSLNGELLTRDYHDMKEVIVVRKNTHSSSISDLIRIEFYVFKGRIKNSENNVPRRELLR